MSYKLLVFKGEGKGKGAGLSKYCVFPYAETRIVGRKYPLSIAAN